MSNWGVTKPVRKRKTPTTITKANAKNPLDYQRINVNVHKDIYARLKGLAAIQHTTMGDLVEAAINRVYGKQLNEMDKQINLQSDEDA